MKKQIPILFSTAMVQAILAGRKTVTRRIVKAELDERGLRYCNPRTRWEDWHGKGITRPYGKPGDILWVRETWRKYCWVDENGYTHFDHEIFEFAADGHTPLPLIDGDGFRMYNKDGSEKYVPWRPSIRMPKSRARIWLEVTDIRVERLQDISEADAIAEGVEPDYIADLNCNGELSKGESIAHRAAFMVLWENINGTGSWEANPWAWVISFRVLSSTGKPAGLEKEEAV